MATRDYVNQHKPVIALAQATVTATANGATIDTQGFEVVAHFVFVGKAGDTLSPTVSIALCLQESDDGTTWTYCNDQEIAVPRPQSVNGYGIGTANGAPQNGCFALITASASLPASATAFAEFGVSYFGPKPYVRVVDFRSGAQATGTASFALALLGYPQYKPVWGNNS